MRRPQRSLLQCLLQAQVRGLLRQPERWLVRAEDRAQVWVQVQQRKQTLLRCDERAQARGPVIGPERGHERPLYPVPWRRLLRMPEQGPHQGQALAQLSGRRLQKRSDRWISNE